MKNEKIKRNIAGLLALVQLGLVAGCSSKNLKDGKSETLAAIEEMQDAKSGDEEDLTDASIVEFNEELLKELGIEFNISQDETIQFNISTLNDFLSQYQNVSYSIKTDTNDEKVYVENEITFKNSKGTIATVTLAKCKDYEELSIYLEPLYTSDRTNYSVPTNNSRHLITQRSYYDMDEFAEKWWLRNTLYALYDYQFYFDVFDDVQGYDQIHKDVSFYTYNTEIGLELHIELNLVADTNEHISLGEYINEPNGTYALEFKVANCDGSRTFKADITPEEYKTLYDIMHLNKSCDIELAIKDALIEIIQRYASEEQSKPLIELLNSANTYTRKR